MITGTVVVFVPHVFSRSFYFVSFSIVFKEVFLSVGMDISINREVLYFLSFTFFVIIIIIIIIIIIF